MIKSLTAALAAVFIPMLAPAENLMEGGSMLFRPDGANFHVYARGGEIFYLNAARSTGLGIAKSFEKLATGKRIVRAGDDPAGLAVAEKIKSIVTEMKRRSMNHADWRNYLNFRESSLAQSSGSLQRIRVLAVRASNGILDSSDRELIQTEIDLLVESIDSSARFTVFNEMAVIEDCTSESLGVAGVSVVRNPAAVIERVDRALSRLTYLRTAAGASANVMTWRMEGAENYMVNMTASYSRMADLDMAEEISSLARDGVLLRTQYGLVLRRAVSR